MKRLIVLYDGACPLCREVVRRLRVEPMLVPVEFLISGSYTTAQRLPGLVMPTDVTEVVAVTDEGEVYRGDAAWLMVLWALRRYRLWSFTLAQPGYRPLVKKVVSLIGRHRMTLSTILWLHKQGELENVPSVACEGNACVGAFKSVREGVGGAGLT